MFSIINKKIKLKIILLLIIAITVFTAIFSTYNYYSKVDGMDVVLQNKLNRTIIRLNQNLIVPLWEIDSIWVNTILETEMLDKRLYAVVVNGDGGLYVGKKRDEQWRSVDFKQDVQGKYLELSSSVVRDNEIIGDVKIYITYKFYQEELFYDLSTHVVASVLLAIFLIIILYILIDSVILNPIQNLLTTIQGTSKGISKNILKQVSDDEIGTLAKEYNSMMINLQKKEDMMIAQSRHAAMGEMISMIAHQWRQPITVISMIANNMILDVELDEMNEESIRKNATKTLQQTAHLSKTIDDFKNFFKPNKKKELVLVNDILEENFSIISKSLMNNNIDLKKVYESETPILIYSRELLQVLINILKNAKEALLENKIENAAISVKTSEDNNYVKISICDNGKGIDEAIISKIYDPYFSTKDEKVGTGLGLYMSKTIIDKHLHGSIKATNQDNSGVCFDILLPKESK